MTQFSLILQSLDLIIEAKLWPDKKPSEILQILLYVHKRGWLYTPQEARKIVAIICAYRIPEITDENLVKMPVNENGKILYIPFVLSVNKEDNIFKMVRATLNTFLEKNQDIEEIVLEHKNNKIKTYKVNTLQEA